MPGGILGLIGGRGLAEGEATGTGGAVTAGAPLVGLAAGWAGALKASNAVAKKAIRIIFISILILVVPAAGLTRCGRRYLMNGKKRLQHLPSPVHPKFYGRMAWRLFPFWSFPNPNRNRNRNRFARRRLGLGLG
jgi:hypothetical protein